MKDKNHLGNNPEESEIVSIDSSEEEKEFNEYEAEVPNEVGFQDSEIKEEYGYDVSSKEESSNENGASEGKRKFRLKGLFSKYRSFDNEKKSTYFYGIAFAILLVAGLILKITSSINNKNKEENPEQEKTVDVINYENYLSKINGNYEEDIKIDDYSKKEYINIKRNNNSELITFVNPVDQDLNIVYAKQKSNVYKIENGKYTLLKEDIFKDKDITFIKPENLLKLLKNKTYQKDNKYMIETSEWLKLYNEINETSFEKKVTGELEIEVVSLENNELNLSMDFTNLYKNLGYDYSKVVYTLKIYNVGNIDFSKEFPTSDNEEDDSSTNDNEKIGEQIGEIINAIFGDKIKIEE